MVDSGKWQGLSRQAMIRSRQALKRGRQIITQFEGELNEAIAYTGGQEIWKNKWTDIDYLHAEWTATLDEAQACYEYGTNEAMRAMDALKGECNIIGPKMKDDY